MLVGPTEIVHQPRLNARNTGAKLSKSVSRSSSLWELPHLTFEVGMGVSPTEKPTDGFGHPNHL